MWYIVLGVLAYPVLLVHDHASHSGRKVVGLSLFALGCALLIFSYCMLWLSPAVWIIPDFVRYTGVILSILFFLLLFYSLMIEIPFARIYLGDKDGVPVIDTGTYALCRHPGVLWLFLFLVSTVAAGGRPLHLAAVVVWTTVDTFYAYLQERLFYPKIFGGKYDEYKTRVPMIIPRWRGVKRCIATIARTSPPNLPGQE